LYESNVLVYTNNACKCRRNIQDAYDSVDGRNSVTCLRPIEQMQVSCETKKS